MSRDKAELRSVGRKARVGLSTQQREQATDAVRRHLNHLLQVRSIETVGLYSAMGSELGLEGFALDCQEAGTTLVWPRVNGPDQLVFHVLEGPEGLVPGWQGILEPPVDAPIFDPAELDLLLVPGVCFDRNGGRLGQGGGYYDRMLAMLSRVHVVGVAFEVQVIERVPMGPLDVPVRGLVTEGGYQDL
ncbi:MAG: 5-formyltetrahydrofolate cyclo-ligase [Myxococcota bacterium]|nr:5-formyltetrahydrofolate cyclo-ligase [Myxococcota bacterium]